jgi:hypothetical protein
MKSNTLMIVGILVVVVTIILVYVVPKKQIELTNTIKGLLGKSEEEISAGLAAVGQDDAGQELEEEEEDEEKDEDEEDEDEEDEDEEDEEEPIQELPILPAAPPAAPPAARSTIVAPAPTPTSASRPTTDDLQAESLSTTKTSDFYNNKEKKELETEIKALEAQAKTVQDNPVLLKSFSSDITELKKVLAKMEEDDDEGFSSGGVEGFSSATQENFSCGGSCKLASGSDVCPANFNANDEEGGGGE